MRSTGAKYQNHSGTFGLRKQAAQAKDHAALVLSKNLD